MIKPKWLLVDDKEAPATIIVLLVWFVNPDFVFLRCVSAGNANEGGSLMLYLN